jgi:alkylation response protein AidB-like acyl-CoA dehydrogenase
MAVDDDLFTRLDLDPDQEQLLDDVDQACSKIRDSETESWLESSFNTKRIDVFRDRNLLGIPIDETYGGRGADAVSNALAMMRVGQEGPPLRTFFSVHTNLGQFGIQLYGSEEQKQQYLPKTTSGDLLAGFGLTEPTAGSNPGGMKTTFEEQGGDYILNGTKTWIGNGSVGDVFVTFAKDKDGRISAFIVESDFDGFSAEPIDDKMGYRNSNHGTIQFDDCHVPKSNLLGEKGNGLSQAYGILLSGRLSVAAGSVGVMQDCLEEAVEYAKEREQWGEKIGNKQLIQRHIGNIAISRTTGRETVIRAAKAADEFFQNPNDRGKREQAEYLTSVAKAHATEAASDVVDRAVQTFGSKGYSFKQRVARHFVDERATRIYEGTTDIHLLKLAYMHLGKDFKAF